MVNETANPAMTIKTFRSNVRELEGVIHSAMIWKRYHRSIHPNGHAKPKLEYEDLERVWNGRGSVLKPEPMQHILITNVWEDIIEPYKRHELTSTQVRYLVRLGLEQTDGNYMRLVEEYFNRPKEEYKKIMDTLRRNDLLVDFKPYRKKRR